MQVYWLEQQATEVRGEGDWLSPAEAARLGCLRIPKRRQDWLLGRWTAKRAIATVLGLPGDPSSMAAIEIRAATSGAPEAFVRGHPAPVSISISHREGHAACAVAGAGVALGCDLEIVELRTEAFVADYFTGQERQTICRAPAGERFRVIALLWSAKESVLKALRTGLRMDVRAVAVSLGQHFADTAGGSGIDDWHPLRACHPEGEFAGWWQYERDLVRTIISAPESAPPVALRSSSARSLRMGLLKEPPSLRLRSAQVSVQTKDANLGHPGLR